MSVSVPHQRQPWFVRWMVWSGVIFAIWLGITIRCQYEAARRIKAAFCLDAPKPAASRPAPAQREREPELEPNVAGIWLRGDQGTLDPVAISSNGQWLVSEDYGRNGYALAIWDLTADDPSQMGRSLGEYWRRAAGVAFSADNRWIAIARYDAFELWDVTTQDPEMIGHTEEEPGYALPTVAISPDNRWLLTAGSDGVARLWDLTAEEPFRACARNLRGHRKGAQIPAAFSADSRWLVTGASYAVRVWDLADDRLSPPARILWRPGYVGGSVAIGPNARWLASGVVVWDLSAEKPGTTARILVYHRDPEATVTIGPTGRWLVTQTSDAMTRLWDLTADDPTQTIQVLGERNAQVLCVAFSPDGHWLLTGSDDATARLWDLTADEPARTARVLVGHKDGVYLAGFTPENHRLVTAGGYGVRLWDFAAARRLPVSSGTGSAP